MRKLYPGESPVLPVGFINLKTGENEYLDDLLTYHYHFTVIKKEGKYALLMGSVRGKTKVDLAHDQTHRSFGTWEVIGEYEKLSEVQNRIHKRAIRGFVFK